MFEFNVEEEQLLVPKRVKYRRKNQFYFISFFFQNRKHIFNFVSKSGSGNSDHVLAPMF